MAAHTSRLLAYADVREAPLVGDKAVLLVSRYGVSQKAAARTLGVNLIVVRKAVKAHLEGRPIGRKGRPPKLSEDEQGELRSTVEKMVKEHLSPTKRGIASEANRILKQRVLLNAAQDRSATLQSVESQIETVSPSWTREWVRNSESLKLVVPRMVEAQRSEGCKKSVIEAWFSVWEKEVADYEIYPGMLANFDETMIQPHTNSKVKVVGFKDSDATVVCKEPELPHITLGVTIFADGTFCDHLLIYPSKFVPQEVRGSNASAYVHFSIAGQDSGWINQKLFAEHCRKTVIPNFLERRSKLQKLGVPNAVGVLLVDGHSSRMSSELMEEFRLNNIKVPVLPSHASHVLQPLDLAVFGAFKAAISKGDSSLRRLTLPERRSSMMLKAMKSLHGALSPDVILRSWQLSGLHPFEPNVPLKHPCILLKDEDQVLQIDEAGKRHGERYNISGKVITNLAEIESIRAVESKKKSRVAKMSENQTPSDSSLMENPESALPALPKRRGRPPKNKSPTTLIAAPVPANLDESQ